MLRELLELYTALLRQEGYALVTSEPYRPEEGDVVELLVSPDALGIFFLIYRAGDPAEVIPVSRFWEFAGPRDVILEGEERLMVQTDLSLELPGRAFSSLPFVKLRSLTGEEMERVRKVYRGEERGAGRMVGVKKEFKRLEARRYMSLWSTVIREAELRQELDALFSSLRESVLVAGEEAVWGESGGVRWLYDGEEETLILLPPEELVGKRKRVVLEGEGREFVLYEGELPLKITLPLGRDAYDAEVLRRRLRIRDA